MALGKGGKLAFAGRLGAGLAILACAFLFVWELSAQYSAHAYEAQLQASRARDANAPPISRICGVPSGPAFVDCVTNAVETRRDARRSEEDLSAQRQMADWAFWMVVVNTITMAIAAIALWFLKETLRATRQAVEEAQLATLAARHAADAAADANTILREGQAVELRPYVYLCDVGYEETAKGMKVQLDLKNFGHTPAANCEISTGLHFLEHPIPAEPVSVVSHGVGMIIPPGHTRRISEGHGQTDLQQLKAVHAGRRVMVVRVLLVYTDMAGKISDTEDQTLIFSSAELTSGRGRFAHSGDFKISSATAIPI